MEKEILESAPTKELFRAVLALKNLDECKRFFRDVCTIGEIKEISSRLRVARMLNVPEPLPYAEIAKEVKTSTATVTRVAHWLHHGMGGYPLILKRLSH
jgi:TrpR-related protein YerC/YecD